MKLNVLLLASLLIICHLSSCNKNDESPDDPNLTASEGTLKAKIDNELWSGYNFKATYYVKFNQLYIVGTDRKNDRVINLYVYVDPTGPIKAYPLQVNGTHTAMLYRNCNYYYTDINGHSVSGNIELSKLDTVQLKVSGQFSFKAFSDITKSYITVTDGLFDDIQIDTSLSPSSPGSYVECMMNGVYWKTPLYAHIFAGGSFGQALSIKATSDYFEQTPYSYCNRISLPNQNRYLFFSIPLKKVNPPMGVSDLKPDTIPISSQWDTYCINLYRLHDWGNPYLPDENSTINIYELDVPNKKLKATFTIHAKDSTNKTIDITDGKLVVNDWEDMR